MTALDLLVMLKREWKCCPRRGLCKDDGMPSNGELRRWLDGGAVIVNGQRPKSQDAIERPIVELVFFPGKPGQVTIR